MYHICCLKVMNESREILQIKFVIKFKRIGCGLLTSCAVGRFECKNLITSGLDYSFGYSIGSNE